jgi:hypothetical protein
MDQKFYLLALYAVKLDPEDVTYTELPDGTIRYEIKDAAKQRGELFPPVSIWPQGVVAESEDQARALGLAALMAECPWQDGWVAHHVTVNIVSRATLLKIVEDATGDHGDSGSEGPELVM